MSIQCWDGFREVQLLRASAKKTSRRRGGTTRGTNSYAVSGWCFARLLMCVVGKPVGVKTRRDPGARPCRGAGAWVPRLVHPVLDALGFKSSVEDPVRRGLDINDCRSRPIFGSTFQPSKICPRWTIRKKAFSEGLSTYQCLR